MGLLDFLKSAKVEEVQKAPRTGGGVRKARYSTLEIPQIRVFKDGSVYPNEAAVAQFDLEYKKSTPVNIEAKEDALDSAVKGAPVGAATVEAAKPKIVHEFENGDQGNGFDIIDSCNWPGYKAEADLLFISPVGKGEGKVDLFGIVRRDEKGEPTTSVLEQGSKNKGEDILDAVKSLYAVGIEGKDEYLDLDILEVAEGVNVKDQFAAAYHLFPKTTIRGKTPGKADYIRRENPDVYLLIPHELVEKEA